MIIGAALAQRLTDSPTCEDQKLGSGEFRTNRRNGHETATSSFYGFLPQGDLWIADPAPRTGLHERLRTLQPRVFAALRLGNYMEAVRTAYSALDALAYELRPWWADCLEEDEALVQAKQSFLQDYPRLSRARGTGFNYLFPWGNANLSGLERRLRRKLGIEEPEERFYIVEHILLRPLAGDLQQHIPILADPQLKDPYSLQLSFVFPDWPPRYRQADHSGNAGFRAFVERTIRAETPAHLVPHIHWLDRPAMVEFETAYRTWLDRQQNYWTDKLGG